MLRRSVIVIIAFFCPLLAAAQDSPPLTLAPSVQSLSSPEKVAIVNVLERYAEAAIAFDPDILASTIHPEAITTGGIGQPLLEIDRVATFVEQLRKMRGKMKFPVMKTARTITNLSVHGDLADAIVRVQYLPSSQRLANATSYEAFQLYKSGARWTILTVVSHAGQYEGDTDGSTLDAIGVRPGMTVGEIGAGEGRVTLPLARRVGAAGRIYANDIDEKSLARLRTAAERTGTKNIETVVGKVDDPLFPKGGLDLVVMAITYHHLTQPVALLKNLAPSLKPGATLVIMDPAYDRTGDKDSDRPTTRERVETEAGEAGYELVAMDASLPRENIFILRLKTGATATVPKLTTAPYVPTPVGDERPAILATIDRWWKGHDTDDAAVFDEVMAGGTRSWFEEEGAVRFISYDDEIKRIQSGNRRPAGQRPAPGEKRTVVDFARQNAVASVTMLVAIPRGSNSSSRSYTTFQLYKADDRWQIVNLAGYNEPAGTPAGR